MIAFMQEALKLAEQGRGRTSPNPTVGAVIERNGEIIGRGFHTWAGKDHAEIVALHEAGEADRGGTRDVAPEPCSHHGGTRPCADTLIEAGVARVVAAMRDPSPQLNGAGFRKLKDAGIQV